MPNHALDLAEDRLQQVVLLVNRVLVVQNLLHSVVVALLSVHGQVLQLRLVFAPAEDCLRKDNVRINLSVDCKEVGPMSRLLDLHRVQHETLVCRVTQQSNIVHAHTLEQGVAAVFQVFERVLSAVGNAANFS